MDHRFNLPDRAEFKATLAGRIRLICRELYGEHGAPLLANELRLPFRTWLNYESGITIPGEVLLEFMVLTGVEPQWLLYGMGEKYRSLIY